MGVLTVGTEVMTSLLAAGDTFFSFGGEDVGDRALDCFTTGGGTDELERDGGVVFVGTAAVRDAVAAVVVDTDCFRMRTNGTYGDTISILSLTGTVVLRFVGIG